MAALLKHEIAAFVESAARRSRPSLHLMDPAQARECYERETLPMAMPPQLHQVRDLEVAPSLTARLFRPTDTTLPVVLFFHGGGWVVGSINTHDQMCRELALRSGCAVLSVDYRLAPEHPFPAAVDDAETALAWLLQNADEHGLDASRLAVAGDSAGGNIAAALTLRCRAADVPLRLQVLFYPVTTTDLAAGVDQQYDGLVLSREELAWHQDQYLPDVPDRHHSESSPLDAADLAQLPAAVVLVAECDPIAPQGLRYAGALKAAGVEVITHIHAGTIHGFAQFPDQFESARTALVQAADALRGALLCQQRARGEPL